MRIVGLIGFVGVVSIAALGCATSFTGSAYVENGRTGCEAKCRGQGMAVAGMVYMGEYSSACVCEVPRTTSAGPSHDTLALAGGGSGGGAVGVIMQMQRQAQQQQQMH